MSSPICYSQVVEAGIVDDEIVVPCHLCVDCGLVVNLMWFVLKLRAALFMASMMTEKIEIVDGVVQ